MSTALTAAPSSGRPSALSSMVSSLSGRASPLSGLSLPVLETANNQSGWMTESCRRLSMTWKIPNYLGQDGNLNALMSPTFIACGIEWCLKVHPKHQPGKDGPLWLGLFLCSNRDGAILFSRYSVAFELGVLDIDGREYKCYKANRVFAKSCPVFGCATFLQRRELLRNKGALLKNGALTVFCVVNVVDMKEALAKHTLEGFTFVSRNLKDLFRSGDGSDVTIQVIDREFKAHKSILASRSPVFAAMFDHNMSESISGFIDITDCEPDVFEIFLTYLYSGHVENCTFSDIKELYSISSKYDAKDLIDNCALLLKTYLSVETFCELLLLSQLHSDQDLEREILIFFISNLTEIVETGEWAALISESPQLVNKLFLLLNSFQD